MKVKLLSIAQENAAIASPDEVKMITNKREKNYILYSPSKCWLW